GGFRPFGLQAHPNGLANQQLILISSSFLIFAYLRKKSSKIPLQKILLFVLIFSIINIILSLSRAAYVAIFAVFFIMWLRHPHLVKKINQELQIKMRQIPLGLKLFIIF